MHCNPFIEQIYTSTRDVLGRRNQVATDVRCSLFEARHRIRYLDAQPEMTVLRYTPRLAGGTTPFNRR